MAGNKQSGFRWTVDEITPALRAAGPKAKSYLSKTTTFHALRAQTYARIMAKWIDRSSNARGGLTGEADNSKSGEYHYEINLYHKVDYGIWLEIRFAERYAIIRPTIRAEGPEYFETARQVLDKMFGA